MGVLYLLSKGATVRKDGGRLVIEKENRLVGRMPIRSLTSIVVGPAANISTPAVFACLENNIPIFFLNKKWQLLGQLANEHASVAVIRQQFACLEDYDMSMQLAKSVVSEKIRNQYRLLKSYTRSSQNSALTKALKMLKAERSKVDTADSADSLRGIEGNCAQNYFAGFGALLDNRTWHFKGRTRPATDPANALLNFGYAFLEREVRIAVIAQGLDTRIGFLHSNNDRKDSLVFDLMELFRQPVIDRFVLNLLRLQVYKPQDFAKDDEDICLLSDEARNAWYQKYEDYMEKTYQEYDGLSPRQLIQKRVEAFRQELLYPTKHDKKKQ
ncbi:CRISPR-associated endonuclease Cas1 [Selenomonas ruminantium]|uniref:CRISPR-associated endonuclease Cas1 n=1 Tax=Selenomonas ruminantium TaxID=971 RepID=A0A1H0NKY5_SELRU|nr:CRISPR-associated endonuclease Cas1 [Selenomonas ruminantium]SDO93208.1 CRISP-associated protein Cas1 [Selenomonas ruminantium]